MLCVDKKDAGAAEGQTDLLAVTVIQRPFWAAPRVRRKFGAQRRIAQGRLCRPRAFEIPQDSIKITTPKGVVIFMEAPPRFELGHQDFADPCLTTWLWRRLLYDIPKRSVIAHFFLEFFMERVTRLELATSTLARWRSTR